MGQGRGLLEEKGWRKRDVYAAPHKQNILILKEIGSFSADRSNSGHFWTYPDYEATCRRRRKTNMEPRIRAESGTNRITLTMTGQGKWRQSIDSFRAGKLHDWSIIDSCPKTLIASLGQSRIKCTKWDPVVFSNHSWLASRGQSTNHRARASIPRSEATPGRESGLIKYGWLGRKNNARQGGFFVSKHDVLHPHGRACLMKSLQFEINHLLFPCMPHQHSHPAFNDLLSASEFFESEAPPGRDNASWKRSFFPDISMNIQINDDWILL